MAIPAEQMAERAAAWAESDDAVRAVIVYGSLAQGTADDDSDLDVIIVAEPGQREAVWDRREALALDLRRANTPSGDRRRAVLVPCRRRWRADAGRRAG